MGHVELRRGGQAVSRREAGDVLHVHCHVLNKKLLHIMFITMYVCGKQMPHVEVQHVNGPHVKIYVGGWQAVFRREAWEEIASYYVHYYVFMWYAKRPRVEI